MKQAIPPTAPTILLQEHHREAMVTKVQAHTLCTPALTHLPAIGVQRQPLTQPHHLLVLSQDPVLLLLLLVSVQLVTTGCHPTQDKKVGACLMDQLIYHLAAQGQAVQYQERVPLILLLLEDITAAVKVLIQPLESVMTVPAQEGITGMVQNVWYPAPT